MRPEVHALDHGFLRVRRAIEHKIIYFGHQHVRLRLRVGGRCDSRSIRPHGLRHRRVANRRSRARLSQLTRNHHKRVHVHISRMPIDPVVYAQSREHHRRTVDILRGKPFDHVDGNIGQFGYLIKRPLIQAVEQQAVCRGNLDISDLKRALQNRINDFSWHTKVSLGIANEDRIVFAPCLRFAKITHAKVAKVFFLHEERPDRARFQERLILFSISDDRLHHSHRKQTVASGPDGHVCVSFRSCRR